MALKFFVVGTEELKECVKNVVSEIRKTVELSFNKMSHHKSGRSGNHGKKFNIISQTIIRNKNSEDFLNSTNCFKNTAQKKLVIEEFEKIAKSFQLKAGSINHK